MIVLYELLDAIRRIEARVPEAQGLAELVRRYAAGEPMSADDLVAIQAIGRLP